MNESDEPEPSVESDEITTLLTAIDTSDLTSRVVATAARVARRTWPNAHLHLLHVFPSAPFDRPAAVGLRSEELVAEAQNHLDFHVRMARRQCPSPVTGHLLVGDPVLEIVRCARSLSADLLLIGAHHRVGLQRFLLGSVAEKVAKRAPCSVFMVREKQRPFIKVS